MCGVWLRYFYHIAVDLSYCCPHFSFICMRLVQVTASIALTSSYYGSTMGLRTCQLYSASCDGFYVIRDSQRNKYLLVLWISCGKDFSVGGQAGQDCQNDMVLYHTYQTHVRTSCHISDFSIYAVNGTRRSNVCDNDIVKYDNFKEMQQQGELTHHAEKWLACFLHNKLVE